MSDAISYITYTDEEQKARAELFDWIARERRAYEERIALPLRLLGNIVGTQHIVMATAVAFNDRMQAVLDHQDEVAK